MSDLVQRLRLEACKNGGDGAYAWRSRNLCGLAADRITALENACQCYLDAYDSATGTVYVEPVIRAVMEAKNV